MSTLHVQQQLKQAGKVEIFQLAGVNVLMQAAMKGQGPQHVVVLLEGSNIPELPESWVALQTIDISGDDFVVSDVIVETAFAFGRMTVQTVTGGTLYLGVSSSDSFAGSGGGGGGGGGGGQTDGLTNAQLRQSPVNVNVSNPEDIGGGSTGPIQTDGLTDDELRASPLAVTGPLTDTQLRNTALPVTGPLTDTQLRAAAVPVSVSGGPTAVAQAAGNTSLASIDNKTPTLSNGNVPVTGPLTDTQLRASAVAVTGTVNTGGLTDGQLRSAPVPVSVTGGATAAKQDDQSAALAAIVGYVDGVESLLSTTNNQLATVNTTTGTVKTSTDAVKASVDAVTTAVGTGNTSLASIDTRTQNVSTNTGATKSSVDAVNSTLGATNTALGTVVTNTGSTKTSVDAVATAVGTGNTSLASVDGKATTIATNTGATKTAVDAVAAKIPALGQALAAASLPVVFASDAPLSVSSSTSSVNPTASFTRPADTTAYSSGDLVGNSTTASSVVPMQFTIAKANGGSAMIRRAKLHHVQTTTGIQYRLHLFRSVPSVIAADNAVFTGTNNIADYLGYFDIYPDVVLNGGIVGFGSPAQGVDMTIKCAAGDTKVYGLLECRTSAYSPSSGDVYTAMLDVLQD